MQENLGRDDLIEELCWDTNETINFQIWPSAIVGAGSFWNYVPFTTCDVISLTVIVQPRFQCSVSCSERESFFLEARERTLGTRLVIVNFDT